MARRLLCLSSAVLCLIFGATYCEATVKIGGTTLASTDPIYSEITNNNDDWFAVCALSKMACISEEFAFVDVEHAKTHIQLRKAVGTAMNQTGSGDIPFGYRNPHLKIPEGFERIPGTFCGFRPCADSGLTPSEAALRVEQQTIEADCSTGNHAAYVIGHRRVLGNARFDAIYGVTDPAFGFKIDGQLGHFVKAPDVATTVIAGDFRFMRNHHDYIARTRAFIIAENNRLGTKRPLITFAQGENVICVWSGGDRDGRYVEAYSGLGMYNLSEEDLRSRLAKLFMQDTTGNGNTPMPEQERDQITWTTMGRMRILSP